VLVAAHDLPQASCRAHDAAEPTSFERRRERDRRFIAEPIDTPEAPIGSRRPLIAAGGALIERIV